MQFRVRRQTLIGDIYDGRIHMATIGDGLVRLTPSKQTNINVLQLQTNQVITNYQGKCN